MFRANTFFRNFEIQGPADRLLIYGILWVSECLGRITPRMNARLVCFCLPSFLPGDKVDRSMNWIRCGHNYGWGWGSIC